MEYSALCEAIIPFGNQEHLRIFRKLKAHSLVNERALLILIFIFCVSQNFARRPLLVLENNQRRL